MTHLDAVRSVGFCGIASSKPLEYPCRSIRPMGGSIEMPDSAGCTPDLRHSAGSAGLVKPISRKGFQEIQPKSLHLPALP